VFEVYILYAVVFYGFCNGLSQNLFCFFLLIIISPVLLTCLGPSHEVCDSFSEAAHVHIIGF
jgi:hypothetical protein